MAITLSETIHAASESVGRLNLTGDASSSSSSSSSHNEASSSKKHNGISHVEDPKLKKPAEVASQSKLVDPFNYVVSKRTVFCLYSRSCDLHPGFNPDLLPSFFEIKEKVVQLVCVIVC